MFAYCTKKSDSWIALSWKEIKHKPHHHYSDTSNNNIIEVRTIELDNSVKIRILKKIATDSSYFLLRNKIFKRRHKKAITSPTTCIITITTTIPMWTVFNIFIGVPSGGIPSTRKSILLYSRVNWPGKMSVVVTLSK